MENSELGTLNPCLSPTMSFPPHRRRPLQSQTYRMFVRIMSHCNALQSSIEPRSQGEVGGLSNGGDKLGEVDELTVSESSMELESSLVQQMPPPDGPKKNDALEDFGSVTVNEVNLSDVMDTSEQGNEELMPVNGLNHVNSIIMSYPSNVVENHSKLSPEIVQNVSDSPSVNEVFEAVNLSTGTEVIADMPIPVGGSNENSLASVVNFSEENEHALQLKQRELEALLSASENLDFSGYDFADEGIEDGEIPGGDDGDQAIDMQIDDAVSLEEKRVDEAMDSEVSERDVVNDDDGDGEGKHNIKSSSLLDKNEGGNDIIKLERRTREEQKASTKISRDNVSSNYADEPDSILEAGKIAVQVGGVKESNHSVISSENLTQRGQITYEDITEIKCSATDAMGAGGGKKKRVLSKERKAKKKKKERIKRAENNKKLGVRRLKLQPVLKPKKVVYCRHYLGGRCQEGEKCKFSHDTTPLTKSTPCSFFARRSCMKGDDCPFDHQLSKYPCNNFVTNGSCSRGADCLFKHEASSTNDPSLISKVSKPELKSPFPTSNSNNKNQVNREGIADQPSHTKCSPLVHSTGKFSDNQVPKNLERSVEHVPKGISFISHVRRPTGNASEHEEAAPNLKADNCVKISSSTDSNQSDNIKKSNETVKGVPLRAPRGINFLSFGKSPLDNSASKEKGANGSLLGQLTKGVGDVKIDNQTGSSGLLCKMANEVSPVSIPGGIIKPLSVPACSQEKQEAVDGVKFSIRTPNGLASSSRHPLWQSLNQGAGNGGGHSSTSKTSSLFNTPTSVQRALQSTLAFAAKIDSEIKLEEATGNPFDVSRHASSSLKR